MICERYLKISVQFQYNIVALTSNSIIIDLRACSLKPELCMFQNGVRNQSLEQL